LERLPPLVRVIDATHPLYGQQLEVSASRASRRIGWVRVVLRDGRHRLIPQKATDLEEAACEVEPNRDLPLVSVRTLLPLAEYVRARISAASAGVDGTSGLAADAAAADLERGFDDGVAGEARRDRLDTRNFAGRAAARHSVPPRWVRWVGKVLNSMRTKRQNGPACM
jgi:hypothetical protein